MASRSARVKQLFDDALDLPEAERATFLAHACSDDDSLRAEVQGLLAALAEASGFLVERQPTFAEGPGTTIDRYTLIERIGEGGFGVVFRAEQEQPMRREVALKVIKLGMDSRRVILRFQQEQKALARMQHPHIATVLDGGTTPSGRPYFVMELVRGLPITRFCREHGLGVDERVALLQQVCTAVQHAHHKGLVHRDLKPANVLVVLQDDGTIAPKVIDFGIAKAMHDDADDRTLTQHGQPIGTLEYMAPEQTDGAVDVDARADVYSLGAVLYELLTGRRPFERQDGQAGNATGLIERIRSGAVVRPSARIAADDGPEPLPGADRRRWAKRLRDELDWIVLRALAKEPARRYPTPNALAEDLGRFLEKRPVEAGPPAALYQLRCFVARHRLAVASTLMVVLLLVAGVISTLAALAETRAQSVRQQRTLATMQQLLLTADPMLQKGPDYTVRQLLDDFASGMDQRFGNDPIVARDLHLTVGGAYRSLGQLQQAERHLTRAVELTAATTDGRGPRHRQVMHEWSFLLRQTGRYDAAEQVLDELIAELRPDRGQDPLGFLQLLLSKADVRRLQGAHRDQERLANEALAMLDADRSGADLREKRAQVLDLLGSAASSRGDYRAALTHYEAALALRSARFGDDNLQLAVSYSNIAATLRSLRVLDRAAAAANAALRLQRKAFGDRHPEVARSLTVLGDLAMLAEDVDAAASLYEEAHSIRTECLPEDHPERAIGCSDRARVALARGDYAAAATELRVALQIHDRAATATHSHAAALQNLGVALAHLGEPARAEQYYRRAYELHLRLGGDSKPPVADCLQNMAQMRLQLADPRGALQLHEQALALRRRHRPDELQQLLASHAGIAAAAREAGELLRAAQADAARADVLAQMPDEHPQRIAAARLRAGREFLDAGDAAAATPLIELVFAFCNEHLAGEWPLGEASSLLAECRLAAGKSDEALRLAQSGVTLLQDSPATADKKQRAALTLARARETRVKDER